MSSTERSTHWSLTINNPGDADYEQIDLARQKGWKVDGQVESGQEGTRHLQLHVTTPQVRFSAVKKAFPRAHIEVARNPQALQAYVHKEDTREGELPSAQEKYPGMNSYFWLVTRILTDGSTGKDGLDFMEFADGNVVMYKSGKPPREDHLLDMLDAATRYLVRHGWHVEQYAVNPAVRSSWKKFGAEMLLRAWDEMAAKQAQTDRQTDTRLIPEDSVAPQEYNHADQNVSQEARESPQTSDHQAPSPPSSPHA